MISMAVTTESSLDVPKRSLGTYSIGLTIAVFSLVLLAIGGLGPAAARPLLAVTSAMLFLLSVGLVLILANQQTLARHIGYLVMLFGVTYWFLSPAFFMALDSEVQVGDRYGMMLRPQSITTACIYLAIYLLFSVVTYWWVFGADIGAASRKSPGL